MIKKRSQIAMETLMIYGVILLIVMLAVGALIYYFGDIGSLLPDKCELSDQIQCENYLISSSGKNVSLELRNRVGRNIKITKVNITGVEDNTGLLACMWEMRAGIAAITIPAGKLSSVIEVDCSSTGNNFDLEEKSKAKASLEVHYNIIGSGIDRVANGVIQAKVS